MKNDFNPIGAMPVAAIAAFLLFSCGCKNGIDVSVQNNSGSPISDVRFSGGISFLDLGALNNGAKQSGFLDMKNERQDGSYEFKYRDSRDSIHSVHSGYYSNGSPAEKSVQIVVEPDSVYIKYLLPQH